MPIVLSVDRRADGTKPVSEVVRRQDPKLSQHHYSKLLPGNIRLLHLLPDEDDKAPIQCQLLEYALQKTGKRACLYEALSYCWGSSDKPYRAFIGERYLPITSNLYAALLRLRDRFIGRVLWVDSICIDQEDTEERGQQVQFMAEIYCKANRVIVWLGEAEPGDHHASKEIVGAALASGDQTTTPSDNESGHEAVSRLLARPWFRRIWVLQEVAAARNLRIMCGSTEVDGFAFHLGLEAYPGFQNPIRPVTYLMKNSISRPNYMIDSSGRVSLGIRPLSELMDMYHTHEASERRDKVFALLGMSSDAPSALQAAGLSPDYDVPWEEVLRRLVQFFLGGRVVVDTFPDREFSIIKAKSCLVGKVSSVNGQRVTTTSTTRRPTSQDPLAWSKKEWVSQPSPKAVQKGDLVCYIDGAATSLIIRPFTDYFSVILVSVPALEELIIDSGPWRRNEDTTLRSLSDVLLVWTWESSEIHPLLNDYEFELRYDDYLEGEERDALAKVARIWNRCFAVSRCRSV
ncbi:HET-domain-containing protein [Canariomyces notabilis]|uniref:HET-domain-containing protein n=1 Tax=Canariomyces notabilis TaxID=2074819 RepID=A0AAN6THZ6_9PEZI|nr:HET-domain-containing protein [Canariomyces arenarius]